MLLWRNVAQIGPFSEVFNPFLLKIYSKNFMPHLRHIGLSYNNFKCSRLNILLRKFKEQNVEIYMKN
ncbi:uncharacterized protein LOC129786905 [Lutzomyia longipalpis]|uniref:uncharacterized protein LOC129786905 n=1 Tax=Lutzomyia longipalpis TaxID=7200 RepID=UPI0024843AEA|nr:uncharacterized protein LOC129786905 [Lutzomyia longipalpis]